MATKEKRGAKYGRGTRSPSAKRQRARSDANKARRIKRALPGSLGHIPKRHHPDDALPKAFIELKRSIAIKRERKALQATLHHAEAGTLIAPLAEKLVVAAATLRRINLRDYKLALKARQARR